MNAILAVFISGLLCGISIGFTSQWLRKLLRERRGQRTKLNAVDVEYVEGSFIYATLYSDQWTEKVQLDSLSARLIVKELEEGRSGVPYHTRAPPQLIVLDGGVKPFEPPKE